MRSPTPAVFTASVLAAVAALPSAGPGLAPGAPAPVVRPGCVLFPAFASGPYAWPPVRLVRGRRGRVVAYSPAAVWCRRGAPSRVFSGPGAVARALAWAVSV